MKILQIHNKYLERGGEDTVVANERVLLEQNGHDVLLCEFDNKDLEGLPQLNLFRRTVFNVKSYKKVLECIDTFKPDVIHIHNIYYEASSSIFMAIKKRNIPAVMTIHNYRFGCIQSLLFRHNAVCQLCFDKKNTFYGVKYRCFKDSYLKSLQLTIVNKVNRWVLKYSNPIKKFIFLSEFTQHMMSPVLSIKNTEGVIKPNYVRDFGYTSMESREDYYLFIGRLNEQKGLKILINIFIKNKKNLEIIGTGHLENYVKEIVEQYPNIRYLGFANNAFIIEKLKKSRALIVPSITYEGQPMTIIEAFSTGTPVFASNIKNLDTIVSDGQNGFLFDPYYIDYIFKVFEQMNDAEMVAMYANARKEYEEKYSPESNYRQLINIYEGVIALNKNAEINQLIVPELKERLLRKTT
jgi:glycosyltransferase involved in cell wall biosynthesis